MAAKVSLLEKNHYVKYHAQYQLIEQYYSERIKYYTNYAVNEYYHNSNRSNFQAKKGEGILASTSFVGLERAKFSFVIPPLFPENGNRYLFNYVLGLNKIYNVK